MPAAPLWSIRSVRLEPKLADASTSMEAVHMTTQAPAAGNVRVETDALGQVAVPADRLWGAQTQRALANFPIGTDRFQWGRPVIRALGIVKKCAALANGELGQLARDKVDLIVRAAQDV